MGIRQDLPLRGEGSGTENAGRSVGCEMMKYKEEIFMGLFNKKKIAAEKLGEKNEIANEALKERIAISAIKVLQENTDYENLAYTKIEYGYLFDIEGHGIESLFKVITDKKTRYFAVQGMNLECLDLSEELYQTFVDAFLDIHG